MAKYSNMTAHPFADLFPMMGEDDEAELRASMQAHGFNPAFPIVLHDGWILDGRNRYAVATSLGIEPVVREFEGDDDDALSFVFAANLARRHLTTSQRALAAAALVTTSHGGDYRSDRAAAMPLVSQSDAAERLGVSPRLVRAAAKVIAEAPELVEAIHRGEITVTEAEKKVRPHVARSSGNVEWYTPMRVLDAARAALGQIDLDPASCAAANKRVKARKFYDEKADGLTKPWSGRVWLNPPYDSRIGRFVSRLLACRISGDVSAAIMLTNNASETAWCQDLLEEADSVCFPSGRLNYATPEGEDSGQPLQGQVLCYFGDDVQAFEHHFQTFGAFVRPTKNAQMELDLRAEHLAIAQRFSVGDVLRVWHGDRCRTIGTIVEIDEARVHAKVRAAPGGNGLEFYDIPLWWDLERVPRPPCVPARGVRAQA